MKDFIYKSALENAIRYDGKANPKALIGRVIGQFADAKDDMQKTVATINEVVQKVNSLSLDVQKAEFDKLGGAEKKAKKQDLKELDNAKPGNVIMRFAPSPSGPMHIGHAITGGLSSLYVKKYGGKFILRIEDTNPQKIDPAAYKLLKRDADFLFGNVGEVFVQSERMQIYYDYAKRFVENQQAYVCTCEADAFREFVTKSQACPCRDLAKEEQLQRYQALFNTYKPGQAVLRFRANLDDSNPAMRDFPLMRINEEEHPLQKKAYRVWPLMNLSVFVDDVEMGMTHIIRAKDHADNAKRQELMYKALNKPIPTTYFLGRYNFEGLQLSASQTREMIQEGKYSGWDDIRLPFIEPMRLRGYQAGAFLAFTKHAGLTKVDKKVAADEFFKQLNAYNKALIDPIAARIKLVIDPLETTIKGISGFSKKLPLHPSNNLGEKELTFTSDVVYVSQKEFDATKTMRIHDCGTLAEGTFVDEDIKAYEKRGVKKQLLTVLPNDSVSITIQKPINDTIQTISAKAEPAVSSVKQGDIVQFERFGFCRLHDKEKMLFYFAHD